MNKKCTNNNNNDNNNTIDVLPLRNCLRLVWTTYADGAVGIRARAFVRVGVSMQFEILVFAKTVNETKKITTRDKKTYFIYFILNKNEFVKYYILLSARVAVC